MNNTLGLMTVSAIAVAPARAGVSLLKLCIHFGVWADFLRVNQR